MAAMERGMHAMERQLRERRDVQLGPAVCECGEPMPMERRRHGFTFCVYCAEEREVRGSN